MVGITAFIASISMVDLPMAPALRVENLLGWKWVSQYSDGFTEKSLIMSYITGRRHSDGQGQRQRRCRAGCAWLLQCHDRPPIAPARIFANRCASRALLERGDLRMETSRERLAHARTRRSRFPLRMARRNGLICYTPDGAGPWPGVVYLTDIWGIRPANQKMARRVAQQGYAVLLPQPVLPQPAGDHSIRC